MQTKLDFEGKEGLGCSNGLCASKIWYFGTKPRRAVFRPLCGWGNGAENRNFPKYAQNPGRGTTKEGRSRMAGLARAKWANGACWRIRPPWGLHVRFTPRGLLGANHVKITNAGVNQARFIYKGEVTLPGLHHSRPGGQLVRFPQPAARIKSPLYTDLVARTSVRTFLR